jgi:hypothetical protein
LPFTLSKAPEVERVDALVIFDLVQEELTLGVAAACHLASSSLMSRLSEVFMKEANRQTHVDSGTKCTCLVITMDRP